jgi:hypothetical protein
VDAEIIRFNVNLKLGEKVYDKNTILKAPFHPSIISELRHNTGTISILKRKEETPKVPDVSRFEEVTIQSFSSINQPKIPKKRGRKPRK